jgi:hypothetical protein
MPNAVASDAWAVMDQRDKATVSGEALGEDGEDDDGTGVDMPVSDSAAVGKTPPLETRFVAGELEIPPTPAPGAGKDAIASVTPPLGLKGYEDADTENPTVFVDEAELLPEEDSKTTVSAPPSESSGTPRPRGKRRGATTPPPVPVHEPTRSKRTPPATPPARKTKPVDDAR